MLDTHLIQDIVDILHDAESILFITGAGISADSGLPTYRGIGGLYDHTATEDGIPIEEALSGYVLRQHPEITWKYLKQIEESCRGASFNQAHQIIADMEKIYNRLWVLTQNIDGFHLQAGSQNVIEIHGNLYDMQCTKCSYTSKVKNYSELKEIPPVCSECNALLRPAVVFFGEMLIPEKIDILEQELSKKFDIIFSIGTTSIFPYIAGPVLQAASSGIPTVEINPGETDISYAVDYKIKATAKEAMSVIYKKIQKAKIPKKPLKQSMLGLNAPFFV